MLLMMWCQCPKSIVRGIYQPCSQASSLLCLPALVFLPTTRKVEERAWERSWGFTNYFMTQKITSLWLAESMSNFRGCFCYFASRIVINILTDHSPNGAFQGQGNQMMKQIMQINITCLKIPSGKRQTSWLFASVELGSTKKQIQFSWGRAGLEPVTSKFQVWHHHH